MSDTPIIHEDKEKPHIMQVTVNIDLESARKALLVSAGSLEHEKILSNLSDEEVKNQILKHIQCWGISEKVPETKFLAAEHTMSAEDFMSFDINSVEPCYTGGGMYIFTGCMSYSQNGKEVKIYMIAASIGFTGEFDLRFVDSDPMEEISPGYPFDVPVYAYDDPEWQEQHLILDIQDEDPGRCALFNKILDWIIKNEPEGNYTKQDIQNIKNAVLAEALKMNLG